MVDVLSSTDASDITAGTEDPKSMKVDGVQDSQSIVKADGISDIQPIVVDELPSTVINFTDETSVKADGILDIQPMVVDVL